VRRDMALTEARAPSQPKDQKARTRPTFATKRAVVLNPGEKKIYTLMQQINTLRNEKDRIREEKKKEKDVVRQRAKAKEEVRIFCVPRFAIFRVMGPDRFFRGAIFRRPSRPESGRKKSDSWRGSRAERPGLPRCKKKCTVSPPLEKCTMADPAVQNRRCRRTAAVWRNT
jgi:hypothetical protein